MFTRVLIHGLPNFSWRIFYFRKMNEADKERFKREKEAFDRGVPSGSVVTTVRVAPTPAEPGIEMGMGVSLD